MISTATTGRLIGAGILAGYVFDIANNFFIQPRIRTGEGPMGLFAGAAGQPGLIGTVVLIGIVSGVVSLLIAALLCRESVGRPFAWLAFLFLGFKATSFGMGGAELASYQLYRALGDAMVADPGGELARMVGPVWTLVTEQRNALHYPTMLLGGAGAFTFYLLLKQSRWVPGWLALAGLLATASQMTGVFTGVLGFDVSFYFLAPLALVQLVLGLWLLVRGFDERAAERG